MFDFLNKKTKEVENQNNNKINSSLKEYEDLLNRIEDTKKYFASTKTK